MWTSRAMNSFLSLTIHYVTELFELKSRLIEVKPFIGKHSGINIADAIRNEIVSWGLKLENITKIIRDNGANIIKACNDLQVSHFGCIAHSLHLVLHAALSKSLTIHNQHEFILETEDDETNGNFEHEVNIQQDLETECDELIRESFCESEIRQAFIEIRSVVSKFCKIVVYFRRSTKALDKLKSLQNSKPKTLLYDVSTRWNSTLIMISRLLELRSTVDLFFSYASILPGQEEFNDLCLQQPTEEMWFNLICLELILRHFNDMTKLLSGKKYTTASVIYPSICLLKEILEKDHICEKGLIKYSLKEYYAPTLAQMKKIRKSFFILMEKRFSNFPSDIKYCGLLDPRFVQLKYYSDAMRSDAAAFIQVEAVNIATHNSVYCVDSPINELAEENEENFYDFSEMLFRTPKKQRVDYTSNISSQSVPIEFLAQKQYSDYLADAVEYSKDVDIKKLEPLEYWNRRRNKFPLIANVARKYFGVVATSVPSERNFSVAGNAVTVRRSNLTGKNVSDIIFLHNNLEDNSPKS